jgi:hypothetical protein
VAVSLAEQIGDMGPFELLSHGRDLPVVAWTMKATEQSPANWSLYDLADRLRDRGWQVPAYRMPANRQDLVVQRVWCATASRTIWPGCCRATYGVTWIGSPPNLVSSRRPAARASIIKVGTHWGGGASQFGKASLDRFSLRA